MDHLTAAELADLARGLALPRERARAERHLSSGCRKCGDAFRVYGRVAAMASADAGYQAPERAVKSVRAIHALQQPERIRIFSRIIGRLVYDSFRVPLTVGIRGRGFARHVLYHAAHYALDLRLECRPGSGVVSMTGQMADRGAPDKPLTDLSVFLMRGNEVVAGAKSNNLGEFQMEYRPERRLRLCILSQKSLQSSVEVSLNRVRTQSGPPGTLRSRPDRKRQ